MAPGAVTDGSAEHLPTGKKEAAACSTHWPAAAKRKAGSDKDSLDGLAAQRRKRQQRLHCTAVGTGRASEDRLGLSEYPACTASRIDGCISAQPRSSSLPRASSVPQLVVAKNANLPTVPRPTSSAGLAATDSPACVALDCEFVGIAGGASALGRCSIVDLHGNVLLDIYSRPDVPIVDYRTPWSGLTPKHMINALPFDCAQRMIKNLIKDKTVVGHAVHNDFRVLSIHHPHHLIRDTSTSSILNQLANIHRGPVSLKRLSQILLNRSIQRGSHCSVEDARATMALYKLAMSDWEESLLFKKRSVSLPADRPENEKSFLDDEFWPHDLSFDTR